MSYIRKQGNGLMGFGGAEACGPNQMWSADYTYNNIKGQCLTPEQYRAWEAQKASGGSGGSSTFDKILGSVTTLLQTKLTPAPVTNITTAPGSGMSNTTKIAIAGGAVLG